MRSIDIVTLLMTSGVLGGGYTRVYGVYQPPVFLTAYTHLSDHK